MNRKLVTGFGLLVFLTFLLGISWPIGKLALREIDPWTVKSITVGCSGIVLLAMFRARGQSIWPRADELVVLASVAAFNISGWHILSAFGLRASDASHAAIIAHTMPIWASILSIWILAERIRLQNFLALALVLLSLTMLIGGNIGLVMARPEGIALMLLAAFSWAYGTVRQKQLEISLGVAAIAGWQQVLGVIPIVAGMMLWGTPNDLLTASSIALGAVGVGLLINGFCYWAWFTVVQIFPVHIASIGIAAVPAIGVVASGLLLGEVLSLAEWGALAFVVVGLSILAIPKADHPMAAPQKVVGRSGKAMD